MEKETLTVHEDEFEYSHDRFDPAYNVLSWVNRTLKKRGIDLVFDLIVLDGFEEEDDE